MSDMSTNLRQDEAFASAVAAQRVEAALDSHTDEKAGWRWQCQWRPGGVFQFFQAASSLAQLDSQMTLIAFWFKIRKAEQLSRHQGKVSV